jgi:hypothetical protein
LACYGTNGVDSRVYYFDSNRHVIELAWNTPEHPNAWGWNDITKAAPGAPAAVGGSALACYGVNGADSRVYYFDPTKFVIELAWDNGWSKNVL